MAQSESHHLRAIVQVQLVEDVADVELDRVLAHAQLLGLNPSYGDYRGSIVGLDMTLTF
jgi:hypothetical protein